MKQNFFLELRKHWKELFGVVLTMVLVLLLSSVGYAIVTGHPMRSAFWGVSAFLILGGLPLAALVFGGSFGNGLVRAAERASEESLPVSPPHKIFSSYFASLFCYFVTILVFYVLFLLTRTPSLILDAFDFDRLRILLLPLHCFAFIFCYWLKQPILGSGLALLFTGSQYFFLFLFPAETGLYERSPLLTILLIVLFQLAILRPLARKIERSGKTGVVAGLLLLLPLIVSCISPYTLLLFGLGAPKFTPAKLLFIMPK